MSLGIYNILINRAKMKQYKESSLVRDENKKTEGEILCDDIVSAIYFLEFNKTEILDNIDKQECRIVPVMFNSDYTKYKDLLTEKIYPVILRGTTVHGGNKNFVEFKEINGKTQRVIKYTDKIIGEHSEKFVDKYNKIDDIKKYRDWKYFIEYIDFSVIKDDYDFSSAKVNPFRGVFAIQWEATQFLKQEKKNVPEVLDFNHRKYCLKDIKNIARLAENVFNEKFKEKYKGKLEKKQKYQEEKNKTTKQSMIFRRF